MPSCYTHTIIYVRGTLSLKHHLELWTKSQIFTHLNLDQYREPVKKKAKEKIRMAGGIYTNSATTFLRVFLGYVVIVKL